MAYNNNIPQATDEIKVSSGQIRENFSQIGTVFSINHEDFNTDNAGKHKFLQMPAQVAAPVTSADEGALFTKTGDYSHTTELMFRRENNGPVVQITQGLANLTTTTSGFAYIGNSLIKWGPSEEDTLPAAGPYILHFKIDAGNIPAFSTPPFVLISDVNATSTTNVFKWTGISTNTTFNIIKAATIGNQRVPFIAIGT